MAFKCWRFVILSLILWGTRVAALESLPLHNDEGLHLTRAVEVWNGHPFWNISDGKIINHWLIAAFYPQNSPVFIGRIATIFVSMVGLPAGCALVQRYFGTAAVVLAGVMWIASPYLFFYERTALSDAEAGALVVVAAWSSLRLARSGAIRDAIITGLVLAAAVLFKFTAAPFALTVSLIILLLSRHPLRTRILNLVIAGITAAICFIPPLAYLLIRGDDFFGIALGWIGVGDSSSQNLAFVANLAQLWTQLTSFGTLAWTVFLLGGLALLLIISQTRKIGGILLLAAGLPLIIMMVFGREVLPRHYIAALPLMLVLAGAGLGSLVTLLDERREKWIVSALVIAVSFFAIFPFMQTTYNDPGTLPLSAEERRQFITDHSSGFGLREAVQAFPDSIEDKNTPIVASMFRDSCLRANFYAATVEMLCANAPGLPQIEDALSTHGAVYVLVDYAPLIGIDVQTLDVAATKIAAYPRPGETEDSASVVLWRLNH